MALKYTDCFAFTELFTVDPPDAPLEDRMVRNIRLAEPMTPEQDYRFKAVFTWDPPAYPYKNVTWYIVRWFEESIIDRSGFQFSGARSAVSFSFFFIRYIARHLR